MRELLISIVKELVDHPEAVEVNDVVGERTTVLELKVHPDDIGKVIGRKGRIINSLRVIIKSAAVKEGKIITLELLSQ
ncbi:KH domain-containing protein [bacterium]|nr:KH domain-containing protein [bacterium]MBU1024451.1 KH domain-containing protein [bacterium]